MLPIPEAVAKRTMLAAVIAKPGEVRTRELALPAPAPTQVRVRLEGCGVCASSFPLWEGRPWFQYPCAPGKPGHEGWGRIDAAGSAVSGIGADRVTLLSYRAFAEFDLAPAAAVVSLPAELAGRPFPGEALGCAMNIFARSEIRAGDTVAIVGIGFLGAALTQLCAHAGARVIALSRRPFAIATARACGASETVVLDDYDRSIERVAKLTGGNFCDRVIEAVGLQGPLQLASEITRERGRLIIAGYHQEGQRQVNLQLWNWRGLDVINAHERDAAVCVNGMRAAVEAVMDGRLDLDKLAVRAFPLERLDEAFAAGLRRSGDLLKAVVTM